MTHPHESTDQGQADELGAFGDALVNGCQRPASTDLEHALVRAYQASRSQGASAASIDLISEDIKTQIWEELMATYGQSHALSTPTAMSEDNRPPAHITASHVPPSFGATWPATVSFTLVLGMLAALMALAWQQVADDAGSPTPTSVAAQGLYDPDDISTYSMMPERCVPNGEVTSDAELAQRSIDDWVPPVYAPAKAVSYETGVAIQESYMHFLRCEWDALHPDLPAGATPALPLQESPEMLTYFSDRLRFDRLYNDLSPEQQDALDAFRCQPRNTKVLETFPLPVNQPQDYAILSLVPYIDEIDELVEVFAPSDVYLLPDGRYGAITGTITTAALANPNAITSDAHLLFIAFVEKDGRYYIDELFTLASPSMNDIEARGRDGTLVANCE